MANDRAHERGRGANGAVRPFTTSGGKAAERTPAASDDPAAPDALAFEVALEELDRIVEALEGEQLPLDESLALYERGVRLTKRCQDLLDGAVLRVERLRPAVESGEAAAGRQGMGNTRADFRLEAFEADED
jgi:exodeoxyribonuclease VII small subunit